MATTEHPELVSSGAGLASTVAVETHGEIGVGAVRARGYWEGVLLRFRRDKFAIANKFSADKREEIWEKWAPKLGLK